MFPATRGLRLAARRGLVLPPPSSARALVEARTLHVLEQARLGYLPAELLQDEVQTICLAQRDDHANPVSQEERVQKRQRPVATAPGPRKSVSGVQPRHRAAALSLGGEGRFRDRKSQVWGLGGRNRSSHSSRERGQSVFSSRDSARSANSLPPVWQRGQ